MNTEKAKSIAAGYELLDARQYPQQYKELFAQYRFCFSKWHSDDCSGCIFKKCKRCPISKAFGAIWADPR